MIPCQRHLFDIPEGVAYLNCAYMSPQLRGVTEAGREAAERKATPWRIAPADFFGESERARGLFARLLGAGPDDVAIVPSASYGIGVAAANVPVAAGQRILVLQDQFPSNVYPWLDLARRRGAEVVTVPRPADGDWTPAVLARIDERTAAVALPHCHWTDGSLVDLVRVGERCRAAGAALVLDLTQSAGALPFDAAEVRPDFAVAASYKWLLGPYSLGFLYVHPRHHQGTPLEHNWIAREGSEDFAGLVNYREGFQPGARRFDVGERSHFGLMPMALAALEQLLAWGTGAVAEALSALTDEIARRAESLGLEVVPAGLRAPHFLGLRFPGDIPAALTERLARERVFVSVRGNSVRVAPHLHATPADVDRLFAVLGSGR